MNKHFGGGKQYFCFFEGSLLSRSPSLFDSLEGYLVERCQNSGQVSQKVVIVVDEPKEAA